MRVTCQLLYSGYDIEMQIVNTPSTTIALPIGHAHAADLEACLDLINTEELDGADGVPDEHMPTVDVAIEFLELDRHIDSRHVLVRDAVGPSSSSC